MPARKPREPRPAPVRRFVQHREPPAEMLACGDERTHDEHEITYLACGTRVCDQHAGFPHACRIPKHAYLDHRMPNEKR